MKSVFRTVKRNRYIKPKIVIDNAVSEISNYIWYIGMVFC